MSELKKGLCITVISFVLFMILIILLKCVDVKEVGLYGLNNTYYHEYNKALDIISDVIFYMVLAFNLFLIGFEIFMMVKEKRKISYKFLVYFGVLVIGIVLWLLFDYVIKLNNRPNIIDGKVEASFPSTHVLLTTYIMLASPYIFLKMEGKKGLENQNKLGFEGIITIILIVVLLVMFVLRFWSGMHWLTDCIGGLLLGLFLFGLYYLVISYIKIKKSQE